MNQNCIIWFCEEIQFIGLLKLATCSTLTLKCYNSYLKELTLRYSTPMFNSFEYEIIHEITYIYTYHIYQKTFYFWPYFMFVHSISSTSSHHDTHFFQSFTPPQVLKHLKFFFTELVPISTII